MVTMTSFDTQRSRFSLVGAAFCIATSVIVFIFSSDKISSMDDRSYFVTFWGECAYEVSVESTGMYKIYAWTLPVVIVGGAGMLASLIYFILFALESAKSWTWTIGLFAGLITAGSIAAMIMDLQNGSNYYDDDYTGEYVNGQERHYNYSYSNTIFVINLVLACIVLLLVIITAFQAFKFRPRRPEFGLSDALSRPQKEYSRDQDNFKSSKYSNV